MTKRFNYVIGDVQGCFEALKQLLKTIQFDPDQDYLWFTGDLVARGENSLGVLRFVKKLADRKAAATVLGNHDLTLIANARGLRAVKNKDRTQDILDAIDGDELIDWLRHQPLFVFPNSHTIVTHAGIPHIWSVEQTIKLAEEIQAYLRHPDLNILDSFLSEMYGSQPDTWSDHLSGQERLRCITNYLTRMRLITPEGRLEFHFKGGLEESFPEGFVPWFDFSGQSSKDYQIVFGHWAALQAKKVTPKIQNVDGGCVWGGELVAYRLEDEQRFAVKDPLQ